MANLTTLDSVRVGLITPALTFILESLVMDPYPELVITSITDGVHNHGSAHYRGEAVDVRTKTLPDGEAAALRGRLQTYLGDSYLVLLEQPGATPETTGQHLHVQLKQAATVIYPPAPILPFAPPKGEPS